MRQPRAHEEHGARYVRGRTRMQTSGVGRGAACAQAARTSSSMPLDEAAAARTRSAPWPCAARGCAGAVPRERHARRVGVQVEWATPTPIGIRPGGDSPAGRRAAGHGWPAAARPREYGAGGCRAASRERLRPEICSWWPSLTAPRPGEHRAPACAYTRLAHAGGGVYSLEVQILVMSRRQRWTFTSSHQEAASKPS